MCCKQWKKLPRLCVGVWGVVHFLFPLSSLLIRQSRSLLLCRTVLVKTYCQSHFHFLNDEMFEKCAWPFSSKQTKVLATLVLILLGIVIFFHPIFFGRSVGKTSRAGGNFAISIITCHGKYIYLLPRGV